MESIIVDANKVFAVFIGEGIVHDLKLAPHPKDAEYFALALRFVFPIWSNEKAFKKQSKVKVFSTSDLVSFLSGI